MEYLDFCSVINIIRKYLNNSSCDLSQVDLLYELFASFINDQSSWDFDFDNGLVCNWINGKAKISPRIISFYAKTENRELLSADIKSNMLPKLYDSALVIQDIYTLLLQDTSISNEMKNKLAAGYPCETDRDKANFISAVLYFSMERKFRKRDAQFEALLETGSLSPITKDYILNAKVPNPCRYFCGRDDELASLHNLLCEHEKVFLHGIAGIGKSELAKAYAKQRSKEYTNILYFTYSGDLKRDIANLDFASDIDENETIDVRFSRHNQFLQRLRNDSLLIIDNFDTVAAKDSSLNIILKYQCRIIFTTRSRFDNYTFMDLKEITDANTLLDLMGRFYSGAEKHRPVLEQIIQTVYSHTLAVELSARLLETGIMEPLPLLNKLKEEKAAMDATDTIGIIKDGKTRKATYYDHIHTLFSLYQLSNAETDIIRNLSLIPTTGIKGTVFANWLKLQDMNAVNDLIEKGFVQAMESRVIALHPMIQEVAVDETKPSVQNCRTLLDSLQQICLRHGEEVPYYKQMFQTIESIIALIENDDMATYLLFLENVFPYMDKYHYIQGMELVLKELSELMKDESVGSASDHALLLNYRTYFEKDPDKAIKLQKEAIAMIPKVTSDNALLVSNLYSTLGGMYKQTGKLKLAKENIAHGIQILKQYELTDYHDSITQTINNAVLLAEMGDPHTGLFALQDLSRVIRTHISDRSMDYALIQEATGNICLTIGDLQQATAHFKRMMAIYEELFEAEPEVIEAKKQKLKETYTRAGANFGKHLPHFFK